MTTSYVSSRAPEVFNGEDSLRQFNLALDNLGHEDATGHAYAVHRVNGSLAVLSLDHEGLLHLSSAGTVNNVGLDDCDYVLIDSGNSSGDSWKGFFFPKQRLFLHLQES